MHLAILLYLFFFYKIFFFIIISIYDNEMYIKSNSLKALRLYLNKLFEDGNLLVKFTIKKPAGVTDRYYYGYKILSNTTPLCLN